MLISVSAYFTVLMLTSAVAGVDYKVLTFPDKNYEL